MRFCSAIILFFCFQLTVLFSLAQEKSIETTLSKASDHLYYYQYDSALSLLDPLYNNLSNVADSKEQILIIYTIAKAKIGQMEFAEANNLIEESKEIYEESKMKAPDLLGKIQLLQAKNTFFLGDRNKGNALIEKAIASFTENNPLKAEAMIIKGYQFIRNNGYEEAKPLFLDALELIKDVSKENAAIFCEGYLGLGTYYRGIENDSALYYYNIALKESLPFLNPNDMILSRVYEAMGHIYRYRREYELTSQCYQNTLKIRQIHYPELHPSISGVYNNLGLLYIDQGSYEKAVDYLNRSMAIDEKLFGPDHQNIGISLSNLGNAYKWMGEYEKAIEVLERSLAIRKKLYGEFSHSYSLALNNLSLVYERLPDFEKALNIQMKVKKIWAEINPGNNRLQSMIDYNISSLYHKRGDYQAALEYIEKSHQWLIPSFQPTSLYDNPDLDELPLGALSYQRLDLKAIVLYEKYVVSNDIRDLENSIKTSELVISCIKRYGSNLTSDNSKQKYIQDIYDSYQTAILSSYKLFEVSKDQEHLNKVFVFTEESKAFLLRENMLNEKARMAVGVPDELMQLEDSLKQEIASIDNQIYLSTKNNDSEDNADLELLRQKQLQTNLALDNFKVDLKTNFPDFSKIKYQESPVGYQNLIDDVLSPNDLVIEYFVGSDELFIIAIDQNGIIVRHSPLDETLKNQVLDFKQLVNQRSNDIAKFKNASQKLYKMLLFPIEEKLQHKNLYIIPDGALNYLPFEILVSDDKGSSFSDLSYLIKGHSLSYQYSADVLYETLKKVSGNEAMDFMAFAPDFNSKEQTRNDQLLLATNDVVRGNLSPLEGAHQEIENIEMLIGGEVLFGNTADESTFKKRAGEVGVIHLATHAIVNDEDPMQSRLLFSIKEDNLNGEDGNLYSWELYNMKLKAKMAVLSACNTGFGKINRGEGVMSIGRAFAYAGCPSIIMSLWPAQDKTTSVIMTSFYEGLSNGYSKDRALREAKLSYLKNSGELFSHPFYWAGFVVQGDPEPIRLKKKTNYLWWIAGGVSLIIILAFALFRSGVMITKQT